MPKFLCQNEECGFAWSPEYKDGAGRRPEMQASGEICPQCRDYQVKEE